MSETAVETCHSSPIKRSCWWLPVAWEVATQPHRVPTTPNRRSVDQVPARKSPREQPSLSPLKPIFHLKSLLLLNEIARRHSHSEDSQEQKLSFTTGRVQRKLQCASPDLSDKVPALIVSSSLVSESASFRFGEESILQFLLRLWLARITVDLVWLLSGVQ